MVGSYYESIAQKDSYFIGRLWTAFACISTTGCVIITAEKQIGETKSLSEKGQMPCISETDLH
jgi:hypothetical protein